MSWTMNRIAALLTSMALITTASAESFLKNSGFDGKLAPWTTNDGKLAPDPENPKNTALRLVVDDAFGLTQKFKWPAEKEQLTLTFRARAETASKASPIQLRVRLYGAEENSALVTAHRITTSGKWEVIKLTIEKPGLEVVSFMLESNRGNSILWLDDVTLE